MVEPATGVATTFALAAGSQAGRVYAAPGTGATVVLGAGVSDDADFAELEQLAATTPAIAAITTIDFRATESPLRPLAGREPRDLARGDAPPGVGRDVVDDLWNPRPHPGPAVGRRRSTLGAVVAVGLGVEDHQSIVPGREHGEPDEYECLARVVGAVPHVAVDVATALPARHPVEVDD